MSPEPLILYFYHDPMCSWCWGYRPTSKKLFAELPAHVERRDILGGLAPDSDEPMPPALRETIAGHWRRIQGMLGTEFNFDFWTRCEPRRSTYPACRAVIAAGRQEREEAMTEAIQHAYYLRAMNPSDLDTLETLAREIGLDQEKFAADLRAPETNDELMRQVQFARNSPIRGFPALAITLEGRLFPVPLDYRDHGVTLAHLAELTKQRSLTA